MSETVQLALVVLVQLAAVAFLVSRLWPRRRSRGSKRPDVSVSSLTRKRRK